jgi:hypothetical protein
MHLQSPHFALLRLKPAMLVSQDKKKTPAMQMSPFTHPAKCAPALSFSKSTEEWQGGITNETNKNQMR